MDQAVAAPQPEVEDLGTVHQERDLLRLLIPMDTKVVAPMVDMEGNSFDEELSVAELMFQSLATDDMTLEEPLLQAIFRDYSFSHKMGETVMPSRYITNENTDWRDLTIDLLAERHVLSPNWEVKHKIHVSHEQDQLLQAVQQALNMLKERRVDRMLKLKQEQLKELTDEADIDMALRTLMALQELKKDFAKVTGRVVVG